MGEKGVMEYFNMWAQNRENTTQAKDIADYILDNYDTAQKDFAVGKKALLGLANQGKVKLRRIIENR